MKNVVRNLGLVLGSLFVSSLALAEGEVAAAGASSDLGLIAIGAAIAVGLATFGAASGQAKAAAKMLEGLTRNPGAADKVFTPFILGLVFMEFQALLGFVIAIIWTLKFAA